MSENPQNVLTAIPSVATAVAAVATVSGPPLKTISDLMKLLLAPAAEQYGISWGESIKRQREANILKIAEKAEAVPSEGGSFNPMVAARILNYGAFADDDLVQNLWAGLLASSRSEDGEDDQSVVFAAALSNMTRIQAKFMQHLGDNVPVLSPEDIQNVIKGLVTWTHEYMRLYTMDLLKEITSAPTGERAYAEIMYVSGIDELVYNAHADDEHGTPYMKFGLSRSGLYFYSRCNGSRKSLEEYYGSAIRVRNVQK